MSLRSYRSLRSLSIKSTHHDESRNCRRRVHGLDSLFGLSQGTGCRRRGHLRQGPEAIGWGLDGHQGQLRTAGRADRRFRDADLHRTGATGRRSEPGPGRHLPAALSACRRGRPGVAGREARVLREAHVADDRRMPADGRGGAGVGQAAIHRARAALLSRSMRTRAS